MTFSLAAASRSLSRLLPTTSPATYAILTLTCLMYAVSLALSIRMNGGLRAPTGGFGSIMNLGGVDGLVLQKLGASMPLMFNLHEPWRFVMAVLLHAGLLHIGFNMWVLMDVGPILEQLYGSARYLFVYVATGVAGYVLSSAMGHFSVGASGALLGLIGVLLALTTGRRDASLQMLRGQLIRWLIYIAVMGLVFPGIDNYAHLGGFIAGYLLGRSMAPREPVSAQERKSAYILGWGTGLVVAASITFMALQYFRPVGM